MHADFERCVAFLIDRLEGGGKLVTDAKDRGGTTRWGISQRAYPALDIANLKRTEAEAIYHLDYWMPVRCDDMHRGLALHVFDASVNHGPAMSARLLQRCLRVPEDGVIGPNTLKATWAALPPSELRAEFTERRLRHYEQIVANDPTQGAFLHGWRMRVLRVLDESGRLSA